MQANDAFGVLWDLDKHLRCIVKYGDDEKKAEAAQELRDKFWEIMNENGVDFSNYTQKVNISMTKSKWIPKVGEQYWYISCDIWGCYDCKIKKGCDENVWIEKAKEVLDETKI